MLKFDEEKQIESVNGAIALKSDIENMIDKVYDKGFDNIYYLGIGGTYASSMQAVTYINGKSSLPVFVQHAAEYYTTGNKRLTDKSIVILSSVTGTTQEVVKATKQIKELGATIIAFVDEPNTPLAEMGDYVISYPENEQLKFFMVADRFMYRNGEFDDYEAYYKELKEYLAAALVEVEKSADNFGLAFAEKHRHDAIHYFIGAGNQWGAVYSYAMCYWEEQSWLRSKSIHAAEFLHGTLEVIDETTPVTLFVGEDEQRELAQRVGNLLPRICGNYTIIDSKEYELPGISDKYRCRLSYFIMHAITQRIDAHVEKLNCHPLEIRRYYRQLDY
ncbi:fructosamine deglycase [Virgibacillus pantothenticus]|uniref:Fructosamine deglycase n=1 Tax=Virgibacillus pantothenticus TaxID=1473 RepID=A0A0L0QMB5_VIRPA|nr:MULTISPECIES: SIS domain-containing protein [Virgibacillus]API93113.1 glucosamine-fructose-6-phosphate aminotransferase [Virgibacillus sp. 6R]KNE19408.1 glucosamine-fructose-6-phosphate aminotransferase [Virgibacillus pantothenticus]MBS7428851.1 SIS domain-containing protein [Virgibacillus sp. 19R1-5]MED3737162.1 SIS domain-containing protein [Virgibacillus pantothenticus]QTY15071.1 SIS domain-containing protein [Virgibacillus pantothenticus]